MADVIKMAEGDAWEADLHQRPPGEPLTGGAPNLAANQGFANVQAQQLGRRTQFLRRAVEAELAVAGQAILPGGFAFSRDGDLVANRTVSPITPTGTTLATLVSDGFTNEGLRSSAIARSTDVTVAPVFPHVEGGSGRLPLTNNGDGTIAVGTGATWVWRGGRRFRSDDHAQAARTFSTAASKTYHLRWHAPGTGIAVPASAYPSGRFELADMAGLSEAASQYDSTFDRMLIAKVVTNASNGANVTALRNTARLQDTILDAGVATSNSGEDSARRSFDIVFDWARVPAIHTIWLTSFGGVGSTGSDADIEVSINELSRYRATGSLLKDFAVSLSAKLSIQA